MVEDISRQGRPGSGNRRSIAAAGRGSRCAVCPALWVLALLAGCPAQQATVFEEAATASAELSLPGVEVTELTGLLCSKTDTQDAEKRHAAILLGILGNADALPCLNLVLVSERNSSVRAAAARALGGIRSKESVTRLVDSLRDPNQQVRIAAALALGHFSESAAVAALERLAAGSGPEALSALEALAASPSPRARAALTVIPTGPAGRFEPVVAQAGTLEARTWFVDASSGDDAGAGSAEAPFRSLSRAVSELRGAAGDRILATAGREGQVFREQVSIPPDRSGTPARPTILAAWPDRPAPILDGAEASEPNRASKLTGIHVGASFVHVRGFVVRNYVENGIQLNGSTGNMVIDCRVEHCDRHGIFAYYSPASTIVRAQVSGCFNQGISVRASPHTAVLGGHSNDNGIDGLLLLYDSDDVLIQDFSASGNKRGIALTRGSNATRIIDARLQDNSQDDLAVEPDCDAAVVSAATPIQLGK